LSARPKIDEIDVQILRNLLKNVHTNFSEIAKGCGMTSNSIRARFNRLKRIGVVKGSTIQINPKKLGYDCISLLQIKTKLNAEKDVYEYLQKIPSIILSSRRLGTHNIHGFAALKNNDELSFTIDQIKSHPSVLEVQHSIWVDVVNMDHPDNLIVEPSESYPTGLLSENVSSKSTITPSHGGEVVEENNVKESYELDKNDWLLISMLVENCRLSSRQIGKKLGVSTQTVGRRLERLRKDVISSWSLRLDLEKIGYIGTAIFSILISSPHEKSKVFEEILRVPNVIIAFKCLGVIDIHFVLPFSSLEQLFEVKERLSTIPGIQELELFLSPPYTNWPLSVFAKLIPNQS